MLLLFNNYFTLFLLLFVSLDLKKKAFQPYFGTCCACSQCSCTHADVMAL